MPVKHRGARARKRRNGHAHRGKRAKRKAEWAAIKERQSMEERLAQMRRRAHY